MTRLQILKPTLLLAIIAGCSSLSLAQEPKQDPRIKPQTARPVQKLPAEQSVKPDFVEPAPDSALPRAISDLAEQIDKLTIEVKLLRKETERNSAAIELMIYEERLSKVEAKLDDVMAIRSQFELREQDFQRRMRNIQQETTLRAGNILRRDEAEAAIRADLQRSIDDARAQKEAAQTRITDLQNQAEYLRRRVETLRKKVERLEMKSDVPTQEQ